MEKIFISYRRADSRDKAGELARDLRRIYGEEQVFRDRENLTPGRVWLDELKAQIDQACAMLVLIGPGWMPPRGAPDERRLEEPGDVLRQEVTLGFERRATVMPVLIETAEMPAKAALPDDLKPLVDQQAARLRDDDWNQDVDRLCSALDRLGFRPRVSVNRAWSALSAALLIAVGLLWLSEARDTPGDPAIFYAGGLAFILTILRGVNLDRRWLPATQRAQPFRLGPSAESGAYGGLLGGALAGMGIGVGYWWGFQGLDSKVTWLIVPEVFVFCAAAGLLLGTSIQVAIQAMRHLVTRARLPLPGAEWLAGGFGGLLGGVIVGGLAGRLFGWRAHDFISIPVLVGGASAGGLCIAAFALFFHYRGPKRRAATAFAVSLLALLLAGSAVLVAVQQLPLAQWFYGATTTAQMVRGGAALGAVLGAILGLQIGGTLLLARVWTGVVPNTG